MDRDEYLATAQHGASRAAALAPDSGMAEAAQSWINLTLEKYDDALAAALLSARKNPALRSRRNNLINMYMRAGYLDQAISEGYGMIRSARYAERPNLVSFALACLLADRPADARAILQTVVRLNPPNIYIKILLAAAHKASGNGKEAESIVRDILSEAPAVGLKNFPFALRFKHPAHVKKAKELLLATGLPE